LCVKVFVCTIFYTQQAFTHSKRLHTEHLHTVLLHMASVYTHSTQRSCYAKKLLHRYCFCTDALTHTQSFYTQRTYAHKTSSTHKRTFRRGNFYTQKLFAHTSFRRQSGTRKPHISSIFRCFRINAHFVQGMVPPGEAKSRFCFAFRIGRRFAREGLFRRISTIKPKIHVNFG